ncbi:MAG: YedE family putative selenium transporter [Dethiobacteria bacterium]
MKEKAAIIIAGVVLGLAALLLAWYGNPANMGFCIACFLRDIAGGLGLHRAEAVQYLRPEIAGLVLGAFFAALAAREFKAVGGSSPLLRFLLGLLMMVGALTFLGCPLRMILRLAGGDWNALVALPGYVLGIWVGTLFLRKGYSLGRSGPQGALNGWVAPVTALILPLLLVAAPALIFTSETGPGSMRAPLALSLGVGLLVGVAIQRTRLCTMGAIRDLILFREAQLFLGVFSIFVVALVGNLLLGKFNPGFIDQPVAHSDGLWNFLGMAVVGLGAVLAGGCPLRQLVLSGEGNSDAWSTVLGMIAGGAMMHNFGLAASGAGTTPAGRYAVIIALVLLLVIGAAHSGAAMARRSSPAEAAGSQSKA